MANPVRTDLAHTVTATVSSTVETDRALSEAGAATVVKASRWEAKVNRLSGEQAHLAAWAWVSEEKGASPKLALAQVWAA